MSREALVSHSDMPERGERVRFAEALAVFEDMHRALKARVAETPEHRALEGLDAALALVAGSTRAGHLDLGGFSAFRGSVELLNDNTPEARALDLFEGALRSMIASASDFDDLPDEDETEDETGEDEIEEAIDEKNETDAADHAGIEMSAAPVIVALYEAAPEAPADEAPAPDEAPTDAHAGVPMETPPDAQPAEDAAPDAEADAETGPAEIEARILELEAELAEARAHQAA